MASPMPLLSVIFAAGMVLGGAALALVPLAPERAKPLVTSVRVANLAVPCKGQTGSKDERGCMARSLPRHDMAQQSAPDIKPVRIAQVFDIVEQPTPPELVAAAPRLVAQAQAVVAVKAVAPAKPVVQPTPPASQRIAAAFAQLPPRLEAVALSRPQGDVAPIAEDPADMPLPPERNKVDAGRAPRTLAAAIPVTAVGANGARRTIVIRPTSRQDVYYYAARRQFAAVNGAQPR